MLIRVGCKNVLDPTFSFLSTYFERSQIHPPTVTRLFLSRYRGSSQGSFSLSCVDLGSSICSIWYMIRNISF